ncbi:MAG TPA: ABC transporter ATP-binding protein [Candidatus Lokiarchaeia archaeon]|nr:ABC transporter ATP-binding protein [Candidatus Lokiarchaeia archaeon]
MIDIENLTKKFGDLTAVDNLTLHVDEGEVFGFLGPNGAGKTTTVRMLCCLISVTSGHAMIGDYDITNRKDAQKIRSIIGLLPENVGLYEDLSAYRNLDFYARLYKVPDATRRERIEYFLKMLDLWEKRDVTAGTFSKGMKQKLAIARALVHDPKILFMDEPTASLDPEASKMVREFILDLKKEKHTIFLTTHNLDEATKICDRVGILKTKLLTVGTLDELRTNLTGKKSMVKVDHVTEEIVNAVKGLGFENVEINQDLLTIGVNDPDTDNQGIIDAIVAAGGRVRSISALNATLEDIYLNLIRS